ncbi:hypothetical protein [Streptomyces yangpuensis]|uniref:hypothetical protein n=1 Tax=Streptomyces yangpuensis TaxID=1648182 RepID=UPI00365A4A42
MSTPDYDMAPPAATATVAPPAAAQPPASGAASASDPAAQRTTRRRGASQKNESLAGVLIPGGALTGLISLCWMVHQFGLPAVIVAILAAAATAVTAAVIKVTRRTAKTASRNRIGRGAGGGGPGGGRRNGRGASGSGRGSGNRSGGTAPSRRAGGGTKGGTAPGALSRKPAGMGSVKAPTRAGAKNTMPRQLGKGGLGAAKTTAGPKPFKGNLFGGNRGGTADKGLGGGGKHRKTPSAPAASSGGLFTRKGKGNGITPGATAPTTPKNNRKPSTLTPGGAGTSPSKAPKLPKSKGGGKTIPLPGGGKAGKKGAGTTPGASTKKSGKTSGKKGGKTKAPTHKGYTWKKNPIRKAKGLAGRGYRAVTSPKLRHRVHQVATPFRAMFRGTRKHGGKLLAHSLRWGGRIILTTHSFLGSIRHSTIGPNWLRPLSRLLYWATSPLAKLITVTRSWTWLNTWIYRTTGRRPTAKPAAAKTGTTAPTAGSGTGAPAPNPGGHASVPSPAATAGKGTPVDNSPVHHAYPLIYAADAIRLAAAAFAAAPADSMKGYEAVIENLGHLEFAMAHLLNDIAEVTQDSFKVNPIIPDEYRRIAVQFLFLGAFVDSAHLAYRTVHAEQIENIEQPSWQGRKWDISANWAHIMPAQAWTDPTVHSMPLLLASGAIRDAGIHIKLHPSGTMFGYEMTIQHLADLSEALYQLMETVASVTETEFRVHPGITDMHRDAGQRFRDLGVAIQGVHFLYRTLHSEQIFNLENPTYQGAKWDQARNG